MDASAQTDLPRRVNERYWSSDDSVNQIAVELELSKSALYAMIAALPAGRACPGCGREAAFANRTARDRGRLSCAPCGWEGTRAEAGGVLEQMGPEEADSDPVERSAPEPPPFAGEASPGLRRLVLSGALLGAAAGILLVTMSRRRS